MATLMYNPPADPHADLDTEPDERWKLNLRDRITVNLSSMVDEARKRMRDRLAQAVVSEEDRESISKEHHEAMNNIRKLAESQFQTALQQERQERRWGAGQKVDVSWSNEMVKEQQAILDKIAKDRKMQNQLQAIWDRKAKEREQAELQQPAQPTRTESPKTLTTDRKADGLLTPKGTKETGREGSYFADWRDRGGEHLYGAGRPDRTKSRSGSISGEGVGPYRAPSALHTSERSQDRPKMPPFVHQMEGMTRLSPPPLDMPDSIRRGNLQYKASISSSGIRSTPSVPEIWKPTITPEQDAAMSDSMRRGNLRNKTSINSSINSSIRSTPSVPEIWKPTITPEQDAAMSRTFDSYHRRNAASTAPTVSYRPPPVPPAVPERDKEPYTSLPSVSPNYVAVTASAYPRSFQPPASASRPGITRNPSIDEGSRVPQQSSQSQNKSQFQSYSRSLRTAGDIPRSWQPAYLPRRVSSKDLHPSYVQQQGPIHTYREEPESEDELSG